MKKRNRYIFISLLAITSTITLIVLIFLLNYRSDETCTIFTLAKSDTVYFGNNEDWHAENLIVGFFPASSDGYGSVHLGYQDNKGRAQFQGAVNEMGLAWDVNSLPKTVANPHPEKHLDRFEDNILTKITKEAATVADAITILNQVDFGNSMDYQIHIADATGAAIIVSNGPDGEIVYTPINPSDGYIVSTNFNHAIEGNGKQGWRYDTAVSMLKELSPDEITIDSLADILNKVHLNMLTTYTLYSDIIDLNDKKIYLYYMSQYNEFAEIDIIKEISKGQRIIKMSDFFSPETVEKGDREYNRFEIRFISAIVAVIMLTAALVSLAVFLIVKTVKNRRSLLFSKKQYRRNEKE